MAAQCLDEHLARSPGDAAANLLRGNLHLHRHAFDDALQRYARAISAEPARADAHYLSAVAHHKRGDDAAAVAALEEALAHSETFWPAAFLLGTIQLRAGRRLRAEVAFEQAVAVLERPDRSPLLTASAGELVNSVHNDPAWALERARACLIAAAPQRATAEGRP